MVVALVVVGVLVAAVALLFFIASTKPDDFTVVRSAIVTAKAPRIVVHLVDFEKWKAWSPWEGLDPSMSRSYSGPKSGVGAHYAWNGNDKVGSGTMTVKSESQERVEIDLTFERPFKAENLVAISLVPEGEGTKIDWKMSGKRNTMMKVMGLFMNMDALIGKDFEKGLAQLKVVVESE